MPDPASRSPAPLWLRALGALVLALLGAGMAYALVTGLAQLGRIGV